MADAKQDQDVSKTTKPKPEAVIGKNHAEDQKQFNDEHTKNVKHNNTTDDTKLEPVATTTAALSPTGKHDKVETHKGVNESTGTAPHPDLSFDSSTSAADTGAVKVSY